MLESHSVAVERQRAFERRKQGRGQGFDFQRFSEQAQVRFREYRLKAEEYARENPPKALATALFGGFVVGRLIRMLTSGSKKRRMRREAVRRAAVRGRY